MDPYLISLAKEYCELVDGMRSGTFSLEELHELDSQRQTTHLELCRITGMSHSADMYRYARTVVLAARGGNFQ